MLDIGFTELLLVAVIALVVLGPERLPGAIRTTAYWVGKIRKSFQSAKEELERELDVDGIKRQIHNEQVLKELEKSRSQVMETTSNHQDTRDKAQENTPQTAPASDSSEAKAKSD